MNPLIPVDGNRADWPRLVANAVNALFPKVTSLLSRADTTDASISTLDGEMAMITGGHPFQGLATAPISPTEGHTYYDTTTHKVRTWDGVAWQDHW